MIDRVRTRTGSDLSDDDLQAMIDGIIAEIDARLGGVGPITLHLGDPSDPDSRYRRTLKLTLPVDVDEPLTIVELDPGNSGDAAAEIELQPGDYLVLHGGRTLQRWTGGPNGRTFWAPMVRVTYTPVSDSPARDEAAIKLVMLDLSYRGGLKSERAGDYQFTLTGDPIADREAIFTSLAPRGGMVMA